MLTYLLLCIFSYASLLVLLAILLFQLQRVDARIAFATNQSVTCFECLVVLGVGGQNMW